jgi:hypothetical protein
LSVSEYLLANHAQELLRAGHAAGHLGQRCELLLVYLQSELLCQRGQLLLIDLPAIHLSHLKQLAQLLLIELCALACVHMGAYVHDFSSCQTVDLSLYRTGILTPFTGLTIQLLTVLGFSRQFSPTELLGMIAPLNV